MNVSEMYRELKMTKDEFFPLVRELGFHIGERAIKIDDRVAVKIIEAIKQKRKAERKTSIFGEERAEATPAQDEGVKRTLELPSAISVKDFATLLQKRVADVIAVLMRNGIMATINETLDFETAAIIAEDFGFAPTRKEQEEKKTEQHNQREKIAGVLLEEKEGTLLPRPPVIVIMGHVDHGKTSLLDAIRKANVAAGESGGITQHIGAYQVEHKAQQLTVIDTPGHEAFTSMRSRGARIADLAILVVAADDGIKPQTIESIHILQEAKLPFIVAINKIDKPEADVDRVKKELSELNLIPEDYGGKTICASISAQTQQGLPELLDMLLLVAEMEKEHIVANPNGATVGTIIESHVDAHTGPVSTVLIQNGTLHIADLVQIGSIPGKIRSMRNWQGAELTEAPPSTPVQLLGLKAAPVVGDILYVVKDKKALKQNIKSYDSFSFLKAQTQPEQEEGKVRLNLLIRADTLGSLEAIIHSLQSIQHAEVELRVLHKGLGSITESDVMTAKAAHAHILGFHVGKTSGAAKIASEEKVILQTYEVIYHLIDYVKEQLGKLLTKDLSYEKTGTLKVLAKFKTGTHHVIVGGRVEEGVIAHHAPVKILRNGAKIGEGVIAQLQKEKKNVGEVKAVAECGMRIDGDMTAVEVGDVVEAYTAQESERTLASA